MRPGVKYTSRLMLDVKEAVSEAKRCGDHLGDPGWEPDLYRVSQALAGLAEVVEKLAAKLEEVSK